jgi:ABC-type multidrug transport system fused ATPase/permease subunit
MPSQYDTQVGQKGTTLSGGQQQRLALGRALLKDAKLLVLDDPLSAVDAETATKIEHELEQTPGQSLVMSSSRLSTIQNMDWIVVMENGQITAQGHPDQLSQQSGWYRDTLARQEHRQKLEADLNE